MHSVNLRKLFLALSTLTLGVSLIGVKALKEPADESPVAAAQVPSPSTVQVAQSQVQQQSPEAQHRADTLALVKRRVQEIKAQTQALGAIREQQLALLAVHERVARERDQVYQGLKRPEDWDKLPSQVSQHLADLNNEEQAASNRYLALLAQAKLITTSNLEKTTP